MAAVRLWALPVCRLAVGTIRAAHPTQIEESLACRVRPSDINTSYAFPSGHTTSAVFILGTLLFVILPLCVAGICNTKPSLPTLFSSGDAHPALICFVSVYLDCTAACSADRHQ